MQQRKGKKDFTAVFGQSKNNKTFLQLLTNIMHKNQWYMLHKKRVQLDIHVLQSRQHIKADLNKPECTPVCLVLP